MLEIQLRACTVRSHGALVAKFHMHDWLILLLLIALDVGLNFIEPFHWFVGEDMMTDLKYPLRSNTVPFWAVPMIAILLPLAVFTVYYFYRRDVYDLHSAVLGVLFSVVITAVITDAVKDAIGRPWADFFWHCFPDGKREFHNVTRNVVCHGDKGVIKEGHKSFPSGNTSWSFAGLTFLTWYLAGKIRAFDRRGHVAKLCYFPSLACCSSCGNFSSYQNIGIIGKMCLLEVFWAGDYFGIAVASFCYWQFFPPPNDIDGWGPHSYFQMLESRTSTQPSSSTANNQM